jgi:hypothetical protein
MRQIHFAPVFGRVARLGDRVVTGLDPFRRGKPVAMNAPFVAGQDVAKMKLPTGIQKQTLSFHVRKHVKSEVARL